MAHLSKAQLDWAAAFLSLPEDALAAGQAADGAGPSAASGAKLPSPMLDDCEVVHDKVRGPENHLLCKTHGHVVDVEAKTVIAHSLAEYEKAHPAKHNGHASSGHAAPAAQKHHGGDGHGAAHDKGGHHAAASPEPHGQAALPPAAPKADQKPPEVPPTKIPAFTGSAKEVFAQECALLETLKPSKDHPDLYDAVVNGKPASIPKAQAEALLADISRQMENTITNIAQYNHSIIQTYEAASAKGLEHIGSGLNKLVSFAKGDGWIHDPGDNLYKLQQQWLVVLTGARVDVAGRRFQAAALKIADGEIMGLQAEHLFKVFESRVQKNADTTLSVLRQVESVSKSIAKKIATAEFGAAGAAAVDAAFAGADAAGEALAGHEVDWAGRFIDLGMDVLSERFGDQAKGAVKDRVKGLLESKLKRLGKDRAKALAEKIAAKLAEKAVEKGSDLMRHGLHEAADKAKGKKMTYADLAKAAVEAMRKPDAETTGQLDAAIEADPDYAKEMAHPA